MRLYEIDAQIEELIANSVDEETGEVTIDGDKLEELQMAREDAIENLALYFKVLQAEVKAFKDEEEELRKRRVSTEKSAERVKRYLEFALHGERFKTSKVAVSYRKSTKLELSDDFVAWAQTNAPSYLRVKAEADKTAITAALKGGVELNGAVLVENNSIQIK